MRVLALTPYPPEGPSSRYRTYNFGPFLEREGVSLDIRPFMTPEMYRRWMAHKRLDVPMLAALAGRGTRRLLEVVQAGRYDLVWIHRQIAPAWHEPFARLLGRTARAVVFDMDDAVFTEYPIDSLLRRSHAATVGNTHLERYVGLISPETQTLVVPTVIDPHIYRPLARPPHPRVRPLVGWIGTGASFQSYLRPVLSAVVATCRDHGADFRVIAAASVREEVRAAGAEFTEWTLDGYLQALGELDIGIMPLQDDEYARGKCAFKLIEYGAMGLPSVATDIGANREVIADGETGFLAPDDATFARRLGELIGRPELRRRLGAGARRRVVEHYSLEAQAHAVAQLFRRLAGG
ncbi:glycosyltransferase family 4 protein [Deinococcus sp. SDU3-2]|uniref:Glycosyltransferase family 4 protein n=1 Tax=Deinococcus terrestris TaxID=2651870 RepID=A0A7X1TSM8_9DEIO|nr:glycosyltransferase [Deinococcus terrestris]MPY67616.1 glycosyltransferase family 4 protein [Deinococcus terrestris]